MSDKFKSSKKSEKQVSKDERVTTSCKECVFAEIDEAKLTQTGCKLGRLDKFKKNKTEIIEAYDDELDFYVITRFCNTYREKDWAECQEVDLEIAVKEETKILLNFIVVARSDDTMEQLTDTLLGIKSLNRQDLIHNIIVVSNRFDSGEFGINDILHRNFEGTSYFQIGLTEDNPSIERCVDQAFKKSRNGYYCVFTAGSVPSEDFAKNINDIINNELIPAALITPKDGINGLVAQTSIHKFFSGNHKNTLVEKVKAFDEGRFSSHVKSWDDFSYAVTSSDSSNT